MKSVHRARRRCALKWVALVVGLCVAATACSASNAASDADALEVSVELSASRVTPPTTSTSTTTTTTTTAVPDPWETWVAVAKPEISLLQTFDAPDGNLVSYELEMRNPWYFGGELALMVTKGGPSDDWVEVQLPVRPNDTRAWIRTSDATFLSHRFHMSVAVGERMVRVYDGDQLLIETPAVVGTDKTPTPLGRFFVNAIIPQSNPGGAYGPVIVSISSFSEVLSTFAGGMPEIGIHGTNQPALRGQARSNGCVRLENGAIQEIAGLVPLGTPVDFVA